MATWVQKLPLEGDPNAWNLFVFRKQRDSLPIGQLLRELSEELEKAALGGDCVVDALVRAGELETAAADAGRPDQVLFSTITDAIAATLVRGQADFEPVLGLLEGAAASGEVTCSHAEGFSYYGLSPLDYGDSARLLARELKPHVGVLGIRSVGSALSAIVAAVLSREGIEADRIGIRPEGEPYRRRTRFSAREADWVRKKLELSADFVVVDEGPGFSGSTLLSVTGALEGAGVPRSSIRIICSRPASQLHDPDAVQGLEQFSPVAVGYGRRIPAECDRNLGGGLWRELIYSDCSEWPSCWTDLERIKHLSLDGSSLLKFEGFGRFGASARRQGEALSEAGFSPPLLGFENGFARYRWIEGGRPMQRADLSFEMLERMGRYCAFRARSCEAPSPGTESLRDMMSRNLDIEFGAIHRLPELAVCRPVYPDCRMMPHEWVQTKGGEVFKTDSVGHGDGHQLPGPVDIAWDLAGAIVEWELRDGEAELLLASYHRACGDDASSRIDAYLFAYLVHRVAYCRMGAASMRNSVDARPLWEQYQRHLKKLHDWLNIPWQLSDEMGDRRIVNSR
jgi:hypothetical protein